MKNIERLPSIFIEVAEERVKHEPLQIGVSFFHGNASFALGNEADKDELSIQMKTMQKVSKAGEVPLMYNIKTRIKYKMPRNGKSVEMIGDYSLIINVSRSINLTTVGNSFHTDYRQVIDFVAEKVLQKMLTHTQQGFVNYGLLPTDIRMPAEKVLEDAKSKLVIGLFSKEMFQQRQPIVQNLVA